MSALVTLIVFCQALGAIIGATSAVWGELAYIHAMRDSKIDHAERRHLDAIAHGLRWGMSLLLLSSFALVVISFIYRSATQPAVTDSYWALVVFALIILFVSLELSHKRVTFALGSAIVFTSWWFLVYLTLGWLSPISFGTAFAFFVVATGVFYGILQYARMLARPK
ncbi:MAG: hypothetical protein WCW36_00880 [Candidatus Paceibacterota bacterium]|jgi:hypothetical protein